MFADREEAGRRLADAVRWLRDENVIVLGLPRGGVPVAAVVARHLDAPLDVIVVRKLGLPYQPELGLGAVGEGGVRVINEALLQATGFSAEDLAEVEERECAEVEARAIRFRGDRPPITLTGRTVILIDDGIATGSTMRAACLVARELSAGRVVVAAPVAAKSSLSKIEEVADEVICLHTPRLLNSVGEWYRDFSQTSVAEVVRLLPGPHHDVTGAPAPNRSS